MAGKPFDRRRFLGAGAGVVAGSIAGAVTFNGSSATDSCHFETALPLPAIHTRLAPRPVVIASGNGNKFKNGGDETCVQRAWRLITEGADVLDAIVAGVNIPELDPEESGVGFGGLPDAEGHVTLDSCCMHGPKKRAGGVGALQGVRTPSSVAALVAHTTDHHLLVGAGAQEFARNMGFAIEDDLNTPHSRKLWLEWKRRTDPDHYLNPGDRAAAGLKVGLEMVAEGKIHAQHFWGTIHCSAVNATGDLCAVTTTSGLAWKIPGRLGDSPILGAGLYVDNEVGAAGSTGRGEANLYNLSSFLMVEMMRQGKHPKDAGMEALKRIKANTVDKRLLNEHGHPRFNVTFYVLSKSGDHSAVAFYLGEEPEYSVCDENGPRLVAVEPMFGEA